MKAMKVPGFVRTLGYALLSAVITTVVGIGVTYAVQQYATIKTTVVIPGMNTLLALSTLLLTASIVQNLTTITLSWLVGGLVGGILLRKRGAGLLGGILTPLLLGLVVGSIISASVPGTAPGLTATLMTRNFTGGVIAGIGSVVGVIPGRRIFRAREMAAAQVVREELYNVVVQPLDRACQNCQGTVRSNALYCGICGNTVSAVSQDTSSS